MISARVPQSEHIITVVRPLCPGNHYHGRHKERYGPREDVVLAQIGLIGHEWVSQRDHEVSRVAEEPGFTSEGEELK